MVQMVIGILATWRVASLLFTEGGPFQLFDRFRAFFMVRKDSTGDTVCFAPTNAHGPRAQVCHMLECFWCTSVWSAFAVGILMGHFVIVDMLAWSTGAIFLGFTSAILQQVMEGVRYKPHVNGGHPNGTEAAAQTVYEEMGGGTSR